MLYFARTRQQKLLATLLLASVKADYDFTCSAGYYLPNWSSGGGCQPCQPGNFCPGGAKPYMEPCPSGMYTLAYASTSCTTCPAGSYCSGSSVTPCTDWGNYFSLQGATSCTACYNSAGYYCDELGVLNSCPAGYICTDGYARPRPCYAGYYCTMGVNEIACPSGTYSVYSSSGISACTPVPAGYQFVASDHAPVACPSGTYNAQIGSSGCTICPTGYYCPSTADKPVYCKPGTFCSIPGLAAAQSCPQGFYCADPTVLPVNCPTSLGYYSGSGYYACVLCPAGYSCIGATLNAMAACASGYYSKTGDGVCTYCPAGYQCADAKIAPLHCESGYYSQPGAIACTICPAGHYCPYQDSLPNICPQGQWAVAGSIVCNPCPLGQACVQTVLSNTVPTVCSQSQITTEYHDACYDCPAGYACPLQLFGSIKMCGPGYYSLTTMDYCQVSMASQYAPTTQSAPTQLTDRTNGYYSEIGMTYQMQTFPNKELKTLDGRHTVACKPGYFLKDHVCTKAAAGTFAPLAWAVSGHRTAGLPCPDGTWSDDGEIECKVCPPGYECSDKTVIPQVEETTCAIGYYQTGGNKDCIICPDGHECNNGETLAPCPIWHYADSTTEGDCLPCPDGYDCTTGVKVACAAGTYSSAQDFTCNSCPVGYSCGSTVGFPTVCAGGTYSMGGASSCTTCPTDFYSEEGNGYCTPVPPGFKINTASNGLTVCAQKTYSDWGDTTCTTCMDGFLCPEKTQYVTGELSCPRGSYCVAGVQTLCPAGTFGIKERAVSQADGCADCPSGYNCVAGTEHFELAPCPLGAYCKDGIFAACPAGTTGDTLFSVSLNDCKTCPAGTSCGEGATTATTCGNAYYCPTGAAAPGFPCPAGTFGGYRSGKTDPSQCLVCPPGYYCPEGTDVPIESPVGHYNPLQGIDSLDGLQVCPPKFYCPNTAMTNYLGFHCVPGYFCPAGSSSATANPCPAGTYNDRTDVHNVKDCLPCPRGFTCAAGSTSSNGNMVVCTVGMFCELGSAPSTTAIQCLAGTYSPYTKAMSQQDCLPCTPGFYCLQAASSQKVTCPAGYYCPEGTQSATQHACPQGTYSSLTGLVDVNQCTACGVGNYCPNFAMPTPLTCGNGYYNDYSVNALYCQMCQEGYYCNAGDVHPVPCAVGYYSPRGASACTRCPLGHYCPIEGTTRTNMVAWKCPAGTFCSATIDSLSGGLGSYPNKDLQSNNGNACDMYYYCPEGTTTQIPITVSSYETIFIYGAGYLDEGVITPAGYTDQYQTECPTGHYCPAGTRSSSWAIKCPKGTYRLVTNGMDVQDCGVCPAGYYCPTAGTTDPLICPTGKFCPEGSIRGQDCPLGTYNNVEGIKESRQCTNCDANYYCPTLGMTDLDLTLTCDQGFVCYGGALRPEPTDTTTGDICPAGAYCTASGGLTYCAAGYIGVFQGAYDISACQTCEKGYYCFGGASGAVTCPAGYFCPAGSSGYDFVAQKPPAGYYNIAGQEAAQACPLGTFTKVMGQSSCTNCEQGFYCHTIALDDPETDAICPSGFYCLSYDDITAINTAYKIVMCPAGTYQAGVSMTAISDCLDCPAGKACEQKGISLAATDLDDCAAGFYCLLGATSKYPYTASGSNYGPCPVGHYCDVATSVPTPCPAGFFSNQERAISIDYCLPCPPGFMCETEGLSQPTGPVSIGVRTADAILENQTCSTLNSQYCPLGTFIAQQCYSGYYQDVAGTGLCKECPVGQFCINGSPNVCLAGYYCP